MNEKAQMQQADRHVDAKYEQMAYYLDKKVRLRPMRPSWRAGRAHAYATIFKCIRRVP